jgi:uncharacterized hydrophobic protein (TIGR00271 family)
MYKKLLLEISDARAVVVSKIIEDGSEPEMRFYTMAAISSAIATYGLMMNSTAVIIGAMLVAPLMTPIFGISLALVRGDASLLGRSIRAEIAGIVLSVAIAACFGFLMPELEATEEMLARTRPNLLDLLVAMLAGFAGAYAMVDEHISPALPGVAIATAIVPPLANTGLCLSLGAYSGAYGSFLLFFANFLSILLVAAIIFVLSGMARDFGGLTKKNVTRRFGLAIIGFLIVAGLLGQGLYEMIQERRLTSKINATLTEEFAHLAATDLQKVIHQRGEEKLFILAHVYTPSDIEPSRVKRIENALEKKLAAPVELFVRNTLSKDVSATGSINQLLTEGLDGFFYSKKPDQKIRTLKIAEQTIREFLESRVELYVEEINLYSYKKHKTIAATVFGIRRLTVEEIRQLEREIQRRTGDDKLFLALRHINVHLYDRWGHAYYEWAQFEPLTPAQESVVQKIFTFLEEKFENSDYFITNKDFSFQEDIYHVLIEVAGLRLFTREELIELKQKLIETVGVPIKLYVRSKPEVLVAEDGYSSFEKFKLGFFEKTQKIHQETLKQMVEDAL